MAREKGTGNLQQEKSGRWTIRVGVNGRRLSRSTGTRDRDKAEAFLNRFLAPLGLGATRLPLAEAWHHYEMSPNRRDIAKSTLDSKRNVWMGFARWMEHNHIEIGHLAEVTETAVAEYLTEFRCHHSATTYNNHVCVLREIFRVLAEKAGVVRNPWEGVCLRADDSMSRRELTIDEVERLYVAASKEGSEWKLLMVTGIYTGMRLGDCCRLAWESVNLDRKVIQVIPEKTKKHMHGRPVTIPIHPSLLAELQGMQDERNRHIINRINRIETPTNPVNPVNDVSKEKEGTGSRERGTDESSSSLITHPSSLTSFVNPKIAEMYLHRKWQLDEGLRRIFKAANITMSVRIEGRSRKTVVASFHSLRHTFVSLSANAGVPLPVVQSIVGHTSTAMTRHYYHENLDALRSAVASIPVIGDHNRPLRGLATYEKANTTSRASAEGMGNGERGVGNGSSDTSFTELTEFGMGSKSSRSPLPRHSLRSACLLPHGSQTPARGGYVPRSLKRSDSIAARLKRLDKYRAKGIVTEDEYTAARQRILAEM